MKAQQPLVSIGTRMIASDNSVATITAIKHGYVECDLGHDHIVQINFDAIERAERNTGPSVLVCN